LSQGWLDPYKEIQGGDDVTSEGDGELMEGLDRDYVMIWNIRDDEELDKYWVMEDYAYHHKMSILVVDEQKHNVYSHLLYHNHRMMM